MRKTTAGSNSQTRGVGLCGRIGGVLGKIRNVPATRHVALTTIEDSADDIFSGVARPGQPFVNDACDKEKQPEKRLPNHPGNRNADLLRGFQEMIVEFKNRAQVDDAGHSERQPQEKRNAVPCAVISHQDAGGDRKTEQAPK